MINICNVGKGQLEYAEDKGRSEGRAEMILNMSKKGFGIEMIAEIAQVVVEEIKKILSVGK